MSSTLGVGHYTLADGGYLLLSGDRQYALGDLAQVPVRSDARLGGPDPARPAETAAASASDPAMYPLTAYRARCQHL